MTVDRIPIRPCPEASCSGLLRSSVHALTMRCVCDACAKEFLVAYVGMTIPWEEASPKLRQIALDAIVQIAYWKKRFDEASKTRKCSGVVAVDTRQKRADALTRVEATHKRLLPKAPKKAEIIPRDRIKEERDCHSAEKSIDEMLDAAGKKTKKGS